MIQNQNRWLEDPEGILSEVLAEAKKIKEPIELEIEDIKLYVIIIAI